MRCEEKVKYDFYLEAGKVVSFLKNKGIRRYIYLCNECHYFHLTSSKPRKHQDKLNRSDFKRLGIYSVEE